MEVQSPFWTLEPAQVRPPLSGVGFVHNRVRFWVPRPQEFGWPVDVHSDHEDQDDQPPLTVQKLKKKRKIKHTKWLIWLIGSFINRIWYPIEKWMEVQSESKTQFWPTCQPVGPCSIRHLQHVFILCIDFKRESKDDSDSGRMKEFRIKAAHQAKKIEKKCEKKRTFYFLHYSTK